MPTPSRTVCARYGCGRWRTWSRRRFEALKTRRCLLAPNSQSLAFFAQEKLKRVDLASPSVQVLADAPSGRGGTWNRNGGIVFAPASGDALYRVPESGEPTKSPSSTPPAGNRNTCFYFLSDDRTFYLSRKPDERESRIMAALIA